MHVFVCVGSGLCSRTICIYLASDISAPVQTPCPSKDCVHTKQYGLENQETYQHIFPWKGMKRLAGSLLPTSGEPRD